MYHRNICLTSKHQTLLLSPLKKMLILSLFEYFTYIIINKKNNTNLLYLTKTKITNLKCLKHVIQLSTRTEGLFQKV